MASAVGGYPNTSSALSHRGRGRGRYKRKGSHKAK